jgi:hypothetical protein
MKLARVVEHQAPLSSYRATQNMERALQLELLIEMTKPENRYDEWHPLIATPFRYSPPHPVARFRPPYGKNIFYGSLFEETALYEHAFHFMKQRRHLDYNTETGTRTLFFVGMHAENPIYVKNHKHFLDITDKNDYLASQQFVVLNPEATFILYPSCRDPQKRDNAAILDINHLEKKPTYEASIQFFYDNRIQVMTWLDYSLSIQWQEVV